MSSFSDLEKCVRANISAPSNDVRAKAEAHLRGLKRKAPQQFFEGVSALLQQSADEEVRSFAAVLLKQNLGIFDESFFKIEPAAQQRLKRLLLERVKAEPSANVTSQVAEAVSHLTCLVLQRKGADWKELMPFLVSLSGSAAAAERGSFFIALDKLACNALDLLRASNMAQLRDLLEAGLQDAADVVRAAALGAVVSLLCGLNEEQELNFFQKLVPLLFRSISDLSGVSEQSGDDARILATCESLQVLAENQPDFLAQSMAPIVACLVSVTQCARLSWDTRQLSLHLLLTLLDLHMEQMREESQSRGLEVAQQVVPLLFGFMQTVDDALPWDAPEDDAEQAQLVFACEMMPITVSIFGAELFLEVTRPVFDAGFAAEAGWKQRLVALKTVEVTLEGCVEQYEAQLEHIMRATGASLADGHRLVQYAALGVVKQLSVVLGEDKELFLVPFAEPMMGAFCGLLKQQPRPHRCVLVQVCDALAHFAYMDEDNEVIRRYAGEVLRCLFALLRCGDALVVSFALKASSVIISIIQEHFASLNVYAPLMQFCRDMLVRLFQGGSGSADLQDRSGLLRGRLMECIGGMLLVVELEQSRGDAHAVIKFLLPFQQREQSDSASESYSYMMSLFASIAEALTAEFAPYLEHVIPPLIRSAQKQTVSISSAEASESEAAQGVVQQDFGGIRFQVNTAEVNEKSMAVQQFPRYAVCLEGALLQFVKPMSGACAGIIKTRALSSEARRHAIEALVPLLHCLSLGLSSKGLPRDQVRKWCTELVEELLAALIAGMQLSDEVDEFSLICKAAQELLSEDLVDASLFGRAQLVEDLTEQLATALAERKVRRQLNEEKSIDLIDTDVEEDVEADLADTVCDLVERLVAVFGAKYVAIFDKHCGAPCRQLLAPDALDTGYEEDQVLALSMLTELVRHGGDAASQRYTPLIVAASQHFLASAASAASCSAQIRQAVSYALGVCAQSKVLRAEHAQNWLRLLKQVVDADDARSEHNADATENAVSAIGKICQAYILPVGLELGAHNAILDWVHMLPLLNDAEERHFCDEYLLSLLKKTKLLQQMVQRKDAARITKLLHIMAVAIVNDDQAKPHYLELLAHLSAQCDAALLKHCIASLAEEWQAAFASSH